MSNANSTIYRQDYQAYPFEIQKVALKFNLDADNTIVSSELFIAAKESVAKNLVLDGENLELIEISLNDTPLKPEDYHLDERSLTIFNCQGEFKLSITVSNQPKLNKTLMGLYQSGDYFYTQCEAEGFRRITFYPDRPDVMSEFEVTIIAQQDTHPILLSNGNLISHETLDDNLHQAIWHDPFPKPAYLFALVAGDFDLREKTVTLANGRDALLQIYSDKGTYDQTEWAMTSLENSIRWDETRFNLSLDLERFMIVAVSDFNMGAMENKGLNIFNTVYVLAHPQTATDANFAGVEAVIGHEYFHNWTGNRVTCRDWFQLSLKEGLTVFREQEFSADMMGLGLSPDMAKTARAVKRIQDVSLLRTYQFQEDSGPMAHPVRPNSYQDISNFYTHTIYEKGAEVIRMLQTILGEDIFQQGMQEYFRRHDGQAVTCDDFIAAMQWAYQQHDAAADLSQFKLWYSQAGWPRVTVESHYDVEEQRLVLTMRQQFPKVGIELLDKESEKQPFHIPIKVGLIDYEGKAQPFEYDGGHFDEVLLHLKSEQQRFTFEGVTTTVIPSLLRNLSAPAIIEFPYSQEELLILAAHDPDHFNRWDAVQRLAHQEIKRLYALSDLKDYSFETITIDPDIVDLWTKNLTDPALDAAYRSELLTLPNIKVFLDEIKAVDPQRLRLAYELLERGLALRTQKHWLSNYLELNVQKPYKVNAIEVGHRRLKNLALKQLVSINDAEALAAAEEQFNTANNMTDRFAALSALVNYSDAAYDSLPLNQFFEAYQHDALVIDKWFAVQASSRQTTLKDIWGLMAHPAFNISNPNRARSLIFQFCNNNIAGFHRDDGSAYFFWAERVLELDEFNPEIAARLARSLENWKNFAEPYRENMHLALKHVANDSNLSKSLREVINTILSATP